MARELRHLCSGHRTDAVAAVDEHEAFGAGDAVPAQAQSDFLRELRDRSRIGARRRRAEDERARAGDVSTRVRVRSAYVADDEIVGTELLREPVCIDDAWKLRVLQRRQPPLRSKVVRPVARPRR